jgi:hypothetical protein
VKYEGVSARLAVERPAAAVVVLRLAGWDTGEFGDAAMKEIAKDFAAGRPLEFFVDARAVKGASIDVSNDWALWLRANRSRFAHVSMLTGSPFVQLTAKFVQRFAELGDLMRIYTDPRAFDAAVQAATSGKA